MRFQWLVNMMLVCVLAPAAAADDSAGPSAQQVLDRAIAAMGGETAFAELDAVRYDITRAHAGGIDRIDLLLEPDGSFQRVERGDDVELETGSDGHATWMIRQDADSFTCRIFAGTGARSLLRTPLHDLIPNLRTRVPWTIAFGSSEFAGRSCHQLVTRYDDGGSDQSFFDVETGLPVGLIRHVPAERGLESATYVYDDWQPHGPLQLFTTITTTPSATGQPEFLKLGAIELLPPPEGSTSRVRVPGLVVDIVRSRLAERTTPSGPRPLVESEIRTMERDEAYAALVEVAQARSRAAGHDYLLELRLRHEFDLLMAQLRFIEQAERVSP